MTEVSKFTELIEQAHHLLEVEYGDDYPPEDMYEYDMKLYKVFGELIVKECASMCYNSNMADSDAHAQNLLYEFNIDNAKSQK